MTKFNQPHSCYGMNIEHKITFSGEQLHFFFQQNSINFLTSEIYHCLQQSLLCSKIRALSYTASQHAKQSASEFPRRFRRGLNQENTVAAPSNVHLGFLSKPKMPRLPLLNGNHISFPTLKFTRANTVK